MGNIVVADKEVHEIEELLLPNGHDFTMDAQEVIRCWDSKDISACPGSGKTTVLLAKLKILADRMPLDYGSGVCVLSHTNVAVNEIKTKLANCAGKLMGYPNYVGTIQAFIDRFLVNPYLRTLTNVPLQVVDDEVYTQHFLRIIVTNGNYRKLYFFLKMQCKASHFDNTFELCKKIRVKNGALYLDKQTRAIAGKASDSAKLYSEVIDILLQTEGMIRYEDTYSYTQNSIDYFSDGLTDLFSERFKYVFVDEYQDCNQMQRDVLERILDSSKSCVMHIGDPDQAIYNKEIDGLEDWKPNDGYLSLASSCRYGQEIADVLKVLRSGQNPIKTTAGNTGFIPTVIIYDEDSRSKVINEYIAVLDMNGLCDPNGTYKVIGAVKNKNLKGLKISDYWEPFDDSIFGKKDYCYWSYIDTIVQALSEGKLFAAEQAVRRLLCKFFHYAGVRSQNTGKEFTIHSINSVLDDKCFDIYRNALQHLSVLKDYSRESVDTSIRRFLQSLFKKNADDIFEVLPPFFLQKEDIDKLSADKNSFKDPLHGRKIQFDTIHGVKGETHDATLILETERNRSSDVKSIFTYFGVGKGQAASNYNRKCLYVGMSRPRKLLCLAIQGKTYEVSKDIFSGWKVIDCRIKEST